MLIAILYAACANSVLFFFALYYLYIISKKMTILHLQLLEIEIALFEPDPDDGGGESSSLPSEFDAKVLKFRKAQ